MAEYNPKRQKTATDDQDRFQEVSICFNLPQQKENNVEEEEFKEVSVPLKAMKTAVSFARSSLSPSTSSEGDEMKQTTTACETVTNLETEAEVIDEEEEEEYAEIEASLFRSLLNADHPVVNESPEDYENAEAGDCMWDEIHANVLLTENDVPNNDDECMYELEEFDDDLTINSQADEHLQTFPIPSIPVPKSSQSTDDDQPVCGKSQLTIPAMMTLLALFTVKYHLPGEAIAHLLTLLSLALPPDHNLPSTLHLHLHLHLHLPSTPIYASAFMFFMLY